MLSDYALPAALAGTVPGLLAWLAARRWGLAGLLGALAICAVVALIGWNLTREVPPAETQIAQANLIFLVIVPGLVSLILGAVAGFWDAHRRRPD